MSPVYTPELTDREKEVLQQVALLYNNEQVALTLFTSANTVKTHLQNIYAKLGVSGPTARGDAVRLAWKKNII